MSEKTLVGLHVTALEHLDSVLKKGLIAQIGPLSSHIESVNAVYVFPCWDAMLDANWLYENWPYESEPVLLSVDLSEIPAQNICADNLAELVVYQDVPAHCINVLSPSEENWPEALQDFLDGGGKSTFDDLGLDALNKKEPSSPMIGFSSTLGTMLFRFFCSR